MNSNDPPSLDVDSELVSHLVASYGVEPSLAERIVESVLISYGTTQEEWIRSRHIRLQRQGLKNEDIYKKIAEELPSRRFSAVPLSVRQIRRMIYG